MNGNGIFAVNTIDMFDFLGHDAKTKSLNQHASCAPLLTDIYMTSKKAAQAGNTCPSRTARKFVTRLPLGLNAAIDDLSVRNHRSRNSEIVMAIESWLLHRPDLQKLQQLLVTQVGFDTFTEIHNRERGERGGALCDKFVIRMLPGMREAIAAEKIRVNKPMNIIVLSILNWWLDLNEDMTRLFGVYSASLGDQAPAEGFNPTSMIVKAA